MPVKRRMQTPTTTFAGMARSSSAILNAIVTFGVMTDWAAAMKSCCLAFLSGVTFVFFVRTLRLSAICSSDCARRFFDAHRTITRAD